jgi:murein DD-endopeptidase MepM/ murein hydrolase activator NlpD
MHTPVQGAIHIRGKRVNNIFGNVRKHKDGSIRAHQGWDITSMPGSPVFAIANGIIRFVKDYGNEGLGKHIGLEFQHQGRTLYAVYGHLQTIEVVQGMFVAEGEQLGTSGQTGNAKGQALSEAHLHLEIRTHPSAPSGLGGRVDPMFVLGFQAISEVIFADMPTFAPIPK